MHEFFRLGSIREGVVFIAVQLFILAVALFYELKRKALEDKQKDLASLIFDIEMYFKQKISNQKH